MPRIFISYRRNDSAEITQRIWASLAGVWGEQNIVKDTDTFLAGPDFREQMSRFIQRSDVVLVVIGQNWSGASDGTGHNRLFDETDPVRTEIEEAFKYNKVVIPILVNSRQMPELSELPEGISELRYRSALPVHGDSRFSIDLRKLNGYFVNPELIALMGKDALPSDLRLVEVNRGFIGSLVIGARTLVCFVVLIVYWLVIGYTTPQLFPPEILRISGSNRLVFMLMGNDGGTERVKVLIVTVSLTIDWLIVGAVVSHLVHGSLFAISAFTAALIFGTLQFLVAVALVVVGQILVRRDYPYRNVINLRKTLLVVAANALLTYGSSFQFLGMSYLYFPLFATVLSVSLFIYNLVGIGLASYSDNLYGINRVLESRKLSQERSALMKQELVERRKLLRMKGQP